MMSVITSPVWFFSSPFFFVAGAAWGKHVADKTVARRVHARRAGARRRNAE